MPLPWPAGLFPSGALAGLAMALAGGLIGAWLGARLAADELPDRPRLRGAAVAAAVVVFLLTGYGLYATRHLPVTATVTLARHGGSADATIRLNPRDGARGANWLTVTSWQGGGLDVDRLREVARGVYRTTRPMPVSGSWKTMIRLHSGRALTAVPVYLPADAAIPVGRIPAPQRFTRPFGNEHRLLQREQKTAAGWLWGAAYGIVLVCALGFLVLLAWGVHRVSTTPPPSPRDRRFTTARSAEPLPAT
jgi:hypothetical protein